MNRVVFKPRKHNISQTSSNFSCKHYSIENTSLYLNQNTKKTSPNSFFETCKDNNKINNRTMIVGFQNPKKSRQKESRFGKFASNKKFIIDSEKNIQQIRQSSQFKVRQLEQPISVQQFFPTFPEDSAERPNQQKSQLDELIQKTSEKYTEIAILTKFIRKCKIKQSLKQVQIIQDKLIFLESQINHQHKITKRQQKQKLQLQEKLKQSLQRTINLQQQCERLRKIIKSQDPTTSHHQFIQQTQKCRILEQKIRSLEQNKTKNNQFIRYLEKKNLSFKQQFAKQRQEFSKIRLKHKEMEQKIKDIDNLQTKVQDLQQQNNTIKINNEMLKEKLAAKNQLIQTMKRKWSQLQQEHQKMNERFINTEQQHKKQIEDLVELLQQIKQQNLCQQQKCFHFANYREILELFNIELEDDKYHCRLLEQIQNFQNMMIKLVNNISEMDDKMWQLKKQRDLMVDQNFVFMQKSEELEMRLANQGELFDNINQQLIKSQAEKLQVKLLNKKLYHELEELKQNKEKVCLVSTNKSDKIDLTASSKLCCENAKIIIECGDNCSHQQKKHSKVIKSSRSVSHFGKVIEAN